MRGAIRPLWTPDPEWFWSHVDKRGPVMSHMTDACWVWLLHRLPSGYGAISPTTKEARKSLATLVAHRVAWADANGPIPHGQLVLHRCDNRACVRPSHLFLGDDKINADDKYAKGRGRHAQGENQHLSKLTEDAVRYIRAARTARSADLRELAEMFGVSLGAVSLAARGRTWKHVK